MTQPGLPEHNADQIATPGEKVNTGRRRLSKSLLATPVVVSSLAARPALACSVSGFQSGNTSPSHKEYTCKGYGCTPGFWKNNPEAWRVYIPGQCVEWANNGRCTQFDPLLKATTLFDILGGNQNPFSQVSATDTLMDIMLKGVASGGKVTTDYADACHFIAAILNAAASQVAYGSTVAEIQAGLAKAILGGQVNYYTTDLLAKLNERGCFLNAHGECEKGFTSVTGTCIPACPDGTEWDELSMSCKAPSPTN